MPTAFGTAKWTIWPIGQWVSVQAITAGVKVLEKTQLERVLADRQVTLTNGQQLQHDRVLTYLMPWAQQLALKVKCS